MCGIFGVINFNGGPADFNKVLKCRDMLAHRGPDDSGIFASNAAGNFEPDNYHSSSGKDASVILSHRRLSIIDLSDAAHQPMTSADRRYTIVYNGEIYNFNAIKEKLASKFRFRTESDTEVILNLFIEKGSNCVEDLRGMFAFAIWDDKKKKLFAARDRFGIKPFYYTYIKDTFVFSSELKPIKHWNEGAELSMRAVDAFLRTGSVPAPLTIYENVSSLLPGHYLQVNKNGISTGRYWQHPGLINTSTQGTSVDAYNEETKQAIKKALLDSVASHLVSDVEVGAFLSGGIDSTAVVSLMRQAGKEKIKTISVTFPGHQLDESFYSSVAAKKYNTDHYEYRLQEEELISDFEKIIEAMDQPTIDGINTYFVSKSAAERGLKVVMSGVGGDELFGGYRSFYLVPRLRKIRSLPLVPGLMKLSSRVLSGVLPAKAVEYFIDPNSVNAEYRLVRGLFTDHELKQLGWKHSFEHPFAISDYNQNGYSRSLSGSETKYVSLLESSFYMRNQLLRDSDVFSMAHSLELRVPLVDHALYEAIYPGLDAGYNRLNPKQWIVDSAVDLPEEIVNREKMGFTFPFSDWMKTGRIKDLVTETIRESRSGYFDKGESLRLVDQFLKGKIHWSRVWALFVLCRFDR